ncbi:hypothetical protein ANANG_G00241540 [Anguilla anguilla]|uniref:Huntingtin-interacting protein 1 clathrin-binding domain-containing protein n=1 Tax=Anguilla anguilla TaxID=7936 RepID=A0A9D3LWG3_ANGAN|nr:hypothetical protein ANANG_G00241540 [Anguilla anguilla]
MPGEEPPNFLRASALSEHISPVVVIPLEESSPETEHLEEPSPETEHLVETGDLVDMDIPPAQQGSTENRFDDVFGTSSTRDPFNFNGQNGTRKEDKDRLIEQLTQELQVLKEELETFRVESGRLRQALQGRVSELEAELAEQRHLKQQALGESEFLRAELEDLRRVKEDTEKEQRSVSQIERKAQANEQRYTKLKEKYSELVQSHADLLRKNAEVTRQVTLVQVAQDEVEGARREMQEKVKAALLEAQRQEREQLQQTQALHTDLLSSRVALDTLRDNMAASQQSREELSSRLSALETERAGLAGAVAQKEAELVGLGEELEGARSRLARERETAAKAAETLQNQLSAKESRELALERQLVAAPWTALQGALQEAEGIVQDSLSRLDDPAHLGCTGSADYLVSRTQAALDCVDELQAARAQYLSDQTGVSQMLRWVARFAHLVGDTVVQGSASSHMAPADQADALADGVRVCGTESLVLLRQLKEQETLGVADGQNLTAALNRVRTTAEKLRPRGAGASGGAGAG